MKPCPNCTQPVAPGANLCPNCGADTRTLWAISDASDQLQLEMPDLTQRKRRDRTALVCGFILGLTLSCLIPFFLAGFIIAMIVYFTTRSRSPFFAKGMLWGGLAGILGATYMCWHGIYPIH